MDTEELTFRFPAGDTVKWTLGLALPVGIFSVIGGYIVNPKTDVWGGIQLVLLITAVVIPFAVLGMRAVAIHIAPEGIKGWGHGSIKKILLPWNRITEVKITSYEGIASLLVQTDDKTRSLFVPIVIAKQPQFREAIVRHAGTQHSLAQALESVT